MVICVDQIEAQASRLVRVAVGPGDPVPLHRGAAAKAILAQLPLDRALALIAQAQLADPIIQPSRSREEWQAELVEVRHQGYALAELKPEGISAVAAAIVKPGRELAAVTIAGPTYCLTDDRLPSLAEQVRETAAEITTRLMDT
jgi:IclR family acetate operon transcriptional repressor